MPDKAWKAFERRVARDWKTVRNALSGRNSKVTGSDTHHPNLFLEGKLNANSPFWRLYLKARPIAAVEGKAVVLCLGKKNHPGYMVAVHSDDLPILVLEWLRTKGLTAAFREVTRFLVSNRKADTHG